MSSIINTLIQRSTHQTHRRSVFIFDGSRNVEFLIPNDNEPQIQTGQIAPVSWSYGDQFASIVLPKNVANPKHNPRFALLLPCTRETFRDLPEPMGSQLVLWDRQERREVWTLFDAYSQAVVFETTRSLEGKEMVDGAPFTHLEKWFNELSNAALDEEGLITTKPPFTSNGL